MESGIKSRALLERLNTKASPATRRKKRKLVRTEGKIEKCIGSVLWLYMHQDHVLTVEQLAKLRLATTPAKIYGRPGTLVRIFAPDLPQAKAIIIKNYDDLDDYAGLILYDGYYFKRAGPEVILIEKRTGNDPSLLEREIRSGGITEVGMKEMASGVMRWLKPFVSFFMQGV